MLSDELLKIIHRCQHADEQAFRRLIELHYEYAFRVSFRVLGDGDESKDAVQETFIRVWQNIGTFDTRMTFTTWLFRIASNVALDSSRRRARRKRILVPLGLAEGRPAEYDGPQKHESTNLAEIAHSLLDRLSPVQRLVFALRDFEDLSIDDVASITGLTEGSVKTNLSYARKKIRTLLDTEYDVKGAE